MLMKYQLGELGKTGETIVGPSIAVLVQEITAVIEVSSALTNLVLRSGRICCVAMPWKNVAEGIAQAGLGPIVDTSPDAANNTFLERGQFNA